MTASIALNSSLNIDATPSPSKGLGRFATNFLKRAKQVGESLRHPSPETIDFVKSGAFVGLSIGAGIGAKALALALFGVATGGTGIAAAVIGGAAVGLSKAAVKHLKERNQNGGSKFFSFSTLKTAGIGAAISTATLGYSELFEQFTGETVTHALGNAFHKVAGAVSENLFDMMPFGNVHAQTPDNVPTPMAIVPEAPTAPVADIVQDNVPRPMSVAPAPIVDTAHDNIPRPMAIVPEAPTAPVADIIQDNVPKPMNVAPAPIVDTVQDNVPKPMAVIEPPATAPDTNVEADNIPKPMPVPVDAVPTEPTAPVATPSAEAVPLKAQLLDDRMALGQHPRVDNSLRERALAWVRSMHPLPKAIPDVPANAPVSADKVVDIAKLPETDVSKIDPKHLVVRAGNGVEVKFPAQPDVNVELNAVKDVVHEHALAEQLRNDYAISFGSPAPESMTAQEMAEHLYPKNPKAYLDTASNMAQDNLVSGRSAVSGDYKKLVAGKLAAACVADLPDTNAAYIHQGGVLPNTCVVAAGQDQMTEGSYITIRDSAVKKPSFGHGLRVLFTNMAERTTDFIGRVVTPEAVPDMAAEKLAMGAPTP